MSDSYLTLEAPVGVELPRVKGSRFLAEALPVADEEAVAQALDRLRRRDDRATHHCVAYRLGPEGALARFDDDGEPGGTAGLPILRQIEARHLTDVLVVVIRYFGGTKLGTGGLIRAYGEAAALALDAASVRECILRVPLRLAFSYDDTSPALHTLTRFDAPIAETHYSDCTELVVHVRRSEAEALARAFREALGGRGTIRAEEAGTAS